MTCEVIHPCHAEIPARSEPGKFGRLMFAHTRVLQSGQTQGGLRERLRREVKNEVKLCKHADNRWIMANGINRTRTEKEQYILNTHATP